MLYVCCNHAEARDKHMGIESIKKSVKQADSDQAMHTNPVFNTMQAHNTILYRIAIDEDQTLPGTTERYKTFNHFIDAPSPPMKLVHMPLMQHNLEQVVYRARMSWPSQPNHPSTCLRLAAAEF